jgi:nucleoside-diphosphate-sugar epimerase
MDSSRLFALGWHPQVDLETGIRRTYEDFLRKQPRGK